MELDKANQHWKGVREQAQNSEPHSFTHFHINTKLKYITYVDDLVQTYAGPVPAAPVSEVGELFLVDLEGFLCLVFSIPPGLCTPSTSSVVLPIP